MESSREAILNAIRGRNVPPAPTAAAPGNRIRYDDPRRQFGNALATVGGSLVIATDAEDAVRQLQVAPTFSAARKVCSIVPGIGVSNVALESVDDPHALEDVDLAILPGEFAVAENAAVWFSGRNVKHRVLPFIAQHLVLVVPAREVVNNLHEAYARLNFDDAGFGVFISGPSKTADIEQSLVIGAHGPRSLVVVLLG